MRMLIVGRTYKDAPNVDGLIFVNADVHADVRRFLSVSA